LAGLVLALLLARRGVGERRVLRGEVPRRVARGVRPLLVALEREDTPPLGVRGALRVGRAVEAAGVQRRDAAEDGRRAVARLVGRRGVRRARVTAVDGLLLLRLGDLGAGEDAAGRDALVGEADVVRAPVERD